MGKEKPTSFKWQAAGSAAALVAGALSISQVALSYFGTNEFTLKVVLLVGSLVLAAVITIFLYRGKRGDD